VGDVAHLRFQEALGFLCSGQAGLQVVLRESRVKTRIWDWVKTYHEVKMRLKQ
jgi:hypothetical protein